MKRFQITEAEYKAIKAKESATKDKNINRRLRVLMLRYEGKKVEEIGQILHLNKGSIATMCRRYREQGLEEYARNKYQSHRWLLNWEREEEILNQFNDGTGKQVTANEIKTVLDEACGKDTGRVYVYNVLKRHGWSKKMPRSRHPKAADEEACEASKKLRQHRINGRIHIGGHVFCENQQEVPCLCSQGRTDSSCQTGPVSQNQIR